MKIVNKPPDKTADISSSRGRMLKEFWQMVLAAAILLVVLYVGTGWAVDLLVSRISFETEARLFSKYQIPPDEPLSAKQTAALQKANTILQKLRSATQVPPLPYKIQLMDYPEPNAFAIPGGTIGITSKLLEILDDDIAVAFVIGHEIGHFHNRDHLKGLGRAVGIGIISAIIFGGSPGSGSFGGIANFVFQKNYSQGRERLADQYGLELVYRAYGKVNGCDHLFKILQKDGNPPRWTYMFATHPSPEERIHALQQYEQTLTASKTEK